VNHLFGFVKNIGWVRDLLTSSNGQKGARLKGAKTVKAIANAAIRSGAEVYIEHQGADGEKLLVHVNPSDAAIIIRPSRREAALPMRVALSSPPTRWPKRFVSRSRPGRRGCGAWRSRHEHRP
jgi:hypothetical protein